MAGINSKLNYSQGVSACHDKLVDLCTKWEMDSSDKDTMSFEIDDNFMSTVYSTIKLLNKLTSVNEIIEKRDYAFDGLEFGATYADLDGIIEEIREAIRR